MMDPKTTPSTLISNHLPEDETVSSPYIPPELIVLEILTTESNPGCGSDAGGYCGHSAS